MSSNRFVMPNAGTDLVGWLSSALLILTLVAQLRKQWKSDSSPGISKWLYLGQVFAELGFVAYSFLQRNWVFLATNSVLLILNGIGVGLLIRQRGLANIFESQSPKH